MSGTPRRGRVLPSSFYARDTEDVARDLIGAVLECTVHGVRCTGRIVETEAYIGEHDPACHASLGRTRRTEGLWGPPGTAYVYLIYGMYWCPCAVTRRAGLASAVLIRAVEPVDGISAMRRRRKGIRRLTDLTSGPGRLSQALGISGTRHHGGSLASGPLRILAGNPVPDARLAVTPRIGLNPGNPALLWPLRWIEKENLFVSARAETKRFLKR